MAAADAGSVIYDSLRFSSYGRDGTFGVTLAVMPSAPRWGLKFGGTLTFPYIPFSADPSYATAGDHFLLSNGSEPELRSYKSDGTLERVVKLGRATRTVTDNDKLRLRTKLLDESIDGNDRRRIESFLAEVPMGSSLPVYQAILGDDEHNAWLEVYRAPGDEAVRWDVITADGLWLGTVGMPQRFRPTHIGVSFVLGVKRDELGVERIQRYKLIR